MVLVAIMFVVALTAGALVLAVATGVVLAIVALALA
jgi:hypothetical protein